MCIKLTCSVHPHRLLAPRARLLCLLVPLLRCPAVRSLLRRVAVILPSPLRLLFPGGQVAEHLGQCPLAQPRLLRLRPRLDRPEGVRLNGSLRPRPAPRHHPAELLRRAPQRLMTTKTTLLRPLSVEVRLHELSLRLVASVRLPTPQLPRSRHLLRVPLRHLLRIPAQL